jgi:hypothetical protein
VEVDWVAIRIRPTLRKNRIVRVQQRAQWELLDVRQLLRFRNNPMKNGHICGPRSFPKSVAHDSSYSKEMKLRARVIVLFPSERVGSTGLRLLVCWENKRNGKGCATIVRKLLLIVGNCIITEG